MIDAGKFLGRGGSDDAAFFEKDDARGEKQRFAKIVSDEDDGFAEAAGEGAEFALKLGAGDGIEGAEGLVHEEDGRVGGEGAGDTDALALAARELVRAAVTVFGRLETDKGKELVDTRGGAGGIPFFQRRDQSNVFGDGEMREETRFLNDIADAAAEADGMPIGGGATANDDLAVGGEK